MSGGSSPVIEPNSPVTLTDADFDSAVTHNPSLIVDCWAPWCGPCRAVAPTIDELAKSYSGRITFGKVNVDDNPRVAQKFGIMSIPTLLFIKNGQLVEQLVGVVPKKTIEEKIQKLL
ncbi:thioredoxin [Candidatus Bathyarchaeota archaeon]|jgi:thioredoxin|nr:thioredoxin [Candidatus Bathyarchaeota archaeon]